MRKFTGRIFGSAHGIGILFAAVASIFAIMGLANRPFNKEFMEDFNAVEARIVFVFNTGRGARARTKLDVEYVYNNKKARARITRRYKGDDYYRKGDFVMIYINPDNENDVG